MFKRLFLAVILLGVIGGGIVGFNMCRDKMIAQYFAGMTPPPVAVSVTEAKAVVWTPGVEAIGTANAADGVDLAVEAAGIVREVKFDSNSKVTKGQLLLQIDDRTEQADLEAAKAGLVLAEANLERSRALQSRGISSTNSLQTDEAAATEARSAVQKLQAALEQKQLMAPFSGTIGIAKVDPGQYVTPGTIYATLQDLDRMRVDFSIPEQEIAAVKVGLPVVISSEVGDLTASGAVIAIEPKIDAASRLITVRAVVENPSGQIYPGQFLRVRVELPTEDGVISVPQTAVTANLYGASVYVLRPAKEEGGMQTVEQVFVTTGRRSGENIEIVKGVSAGEEVVTAGQNRLSNGATVTVDNTVQPTSAAGPASE